MNSPRVQVLRFLKTLKEQAAGPNAKREPHASLRAIAEATHLSMPEAKRACRSLVVDGLLQDLTPHHSGDRALYAILPMGESVLYKVEHGAY